jgi:hypothetical protein
MNHDPQISAAPSLPRSIVTGAIGFCLVSLCVFATVAFGERWLYRNLGVTGAYVTWTVLFVLLSGALFGSLVRVSLPRFYLLWTIAFFAYAASWSAAYFILRRTTGEVVGALVGSILMGVVLAAGLRAFGSLAKICAVLLVANAAGYFLGAAIFTSFLNATGMLLFGVIYGLFFGAGIGGALYLAQHDRTNARAA